MTALNSATHAAEAADAHKIPSAPARAQYTSLTRFSVLGSFRNRLRNRSLPDAIECNARERTLVSKSGEEQWSYSDCRRSRWSRSAPAFSFGLFKQSPSLPISFAPRDRLDLAPIPTLA